MNISIEYIFLDIICIFRNERCGNRSISFFLRLIVNYVGIEIRDITYNYIYSVISFCRKIEFNNFNA